MPLTAATVDDHQDEGGVSPPPTMLQNSKVKEIMGKVVSAQSAKNYSYQNTAFSLYCYESDELRSLLLESWFVERLPQFSKAKDKKTYVKECLLACSPEDNNCPFILSNLTFAHFSNFLSTKTRRKGKKKGQQNSLGKASYYQAKSALVHLFRMSKYDMPMEVAEKLKMFMKGMKQNVAAKSFENGNSRIIGKKKMDFKVYEKICKLFLKEEGGSFYLSAVF
jgi:hypothetical protein